MKVLRPNFEKRNGLATVVVQDDTTKEILMVAYTDQSGYLETLESGYAVFYSTSRKKRWLKGEESGNLLKVKDVLIDCDGDAIVYFVDGDHKEACHSGAKTCFFRRATGAFLFEAPKFTERESLSFLDTPLHPNFKRIPQPL